MKLFNRILIGTFAVGILMSCSYSGEKESNKSTADQNSAIVVTQENFPTAYSNLRMGMIAERAGGVNKFIEMPTPSSNPEEQLVVRMNRDTYYS